MNTSSDLAALVLLALMTLTVPDSSRAAEIIKTPDKLESEATHIVKGKVIKVIHKKEISHHDRGNYDHHYYLTLQVDSVTKGRTLVKGARIIMLAFKPTSSLIPRAPGPKGHEVIPEEGDKVLAHLERDEKIYRILHPNGIRILSEEKKPVRLSK